MVVGGVATGIGQGRRILEGKKKFRMISMYAYATITRKKMSKKGRGGSLSLAAPTLYQKEGEKKPAFTSLFSFSFWKK